MEGVKLKSQIDIKRAEDFIGGLQKTDPWIDDRC
jgi:hypothetical protein